MNIPRYLRTLRHLRTGQLLGQVRVRWQKRFRDPAEVLAKVPGWTLANTPSTLRLPDPVPPQDPKDLESGTFTFIGQTDSLGNPADWTASGKPRLWQYNLHYFDWLWSLLPEADPHWDTAKRLALDWIERHPVTRHACGWEPYPTSLRLMNWALLFGVRHRPRLEVDESFQVSFLESIARQACWLEQNLETHIQANHLLENLAALACVVSVFAGLERDALHARIVPRLRREIEEQILADGMHYERSPMYHLRVLWLMEMLAEVGSSEIRSLAVGPAGLMRQALGHLRHPDGEIAQFNDAAIGIYHDGWQEPAEPGAWALADAGYYGYRNSRGDYLIADAGAIGPDYQPGHAHADFFSFELSIGGRRMITDTGIGTYDAGAMRSADRSTAAHSTVEVAGENSVEVWGSFRVGRRTVPGILRWEPRADGFLLHAEHDGYRHLRCKAIHGRTFEWLKDSLTITDQITVRQTVPLVSRFHLAPGVSARVDGKRVLCETGGQSFVIEVEGPGELGLEHSQAHPSFGADLERLVVVVRHLVTPPSTEWVTTIRW